MHKGCPFVCNWDNPLANMPQVVTNQGRTQGDAQDARASPPPPPTLCIPPFPCLKGWLWGGGGRSAKNVHPPPQNPRYAPISNPRAKLLQGVRGYWQPSGKFGVSDVIGNPRTNSSEVISNFSKKHIFARGLPLPSNPWPEGIDYPPGSFPRVLENLYRHFQKGCPINKEQGNLVAIPLKKPKAKNIYTRSNWQF